MAQHGGPEETRMLRYLLPLTFIAASAAAQAPPMAGEGLRVARQWCAGCHVVSRDMPQPTTGDSAPTFPGLATRSTTTETALRVFMQTPHANMPNWQLSRSELDAVVAYILSLAR